MRAPWPYLVAYLTRGGACWIATRAVVSPLLWFGRLDPLRLSAVSALEMVAVSVGVSFLDTKLRREASLIGNLAIHPVALAGSFVLVPLLGEFAIRLAASLGR